MKFEMGKVASAIAAALMAAAVMVGSIATVPAQDTPAAARIERARPTWYRFERE